MPKNPQVWCGKCLKEAKKALKIPLQAHYELFENYRRMVPSWVKKLGIWRARAAGIEPEDLFQAGYKGLWRACLSFKESKKLNFSTLARWSIRGEILECIEIARYGRRCRKRDLIDQSQFRSIHEDASWAD